MAGNSDVPGPSANGSSSNPIEHRRVEFHPARKLFNGFSNGGGDFRLQTLNPCSDSKRVPPNQVGSEFLENGFDPDITLGITIRKIGAGLENLGNTCFLNSVLQCLTHTEPLAAYLQSGKHQNSCKVAGFCALCAIQRHVSRALQSTGRILAPKDLVSNLRCISRNFRNARQEDAHEYMVNLLESMHKCCLPSGIHSESPSAYDRSLVHKIFGGRLRSQVKCMQCNYCFNTFDPFLDLSLEIDKADSLQKALVNFTAAEQLDGGEKQYQCQKCRQKVRALKQLTVHKAPYVLTIHLKRFRAYNPGQKIDKKVQFGPTLDLKPFVSCSYEGDLKYTLYGVLVHCGFSTHSGHYYSFVRTSGGTWYNLDDNRVAAVGERTVLEQKAYMLFYVRDRRNNAPRKYVDVSRKENMKAKDGGNTTLFTLKQGITGSVQNGTVENRSNGLACSATEKDALHVGSANGSVQNDIVKNKSNGVSGYAALSLVPSSNKSDDGPFQSGIVENGTNGKKDASNLGSTSQCCNGSNGPACSAPPAQKGALTVVGSTKESPLQNKKDSVTVPSSVPSLEAERVSTPDSADAMETTGETSRKGLCASVNVFPSSSTLLNPAIDKLPGEETSQKNNPISKMVVSGLAPSIVLTYKTSDKIDPVKSAKDTLLTKDGDSGQRLTPDASIELGSTSMTNWSSNKEAHNRSSKRKIRKKLQKCQIVSMRLGTNILFNLGKKFKKRKRCRLGSKNLSKEQILASECICISSDLGPSTSDETRRLSSRPTHVKKRAVKSQPASKSAREATKSISVSAVNNENCIDQTEQSHAVLAAEKLSAEASSSNCSGSDGSKDNKREIMQNGILSMLTQGLVETYVPSWDGVDLPSPQIFSQSKSSESIGIGSVGDEWDEEYDMGRKKKVRTFKHTFGGPNRFQELATRKTKQSKKRRVDQSSSGNQPFRI